MDEGSRVIRVYLLVSGLLNLALALIWGVNTLFLLKSGLDIFDVMLVNAAFSFGQVVFEVPTGVVADTIGRRASLLLCLVTILFSTLAYVGIAWLGWGFWPFVAVSVVLGLGFTFYTGAVDAWLVDELKHVGYSGGLEPVFARAHIVAGVAMLAGTIGGGLIGQWQIHAPYLVRAALVVPVIAVALWMMPERGFKGRPLAVAEIPAEMKRIFLDGVSHGLRHPVVRPLMLASMIAATFGMFGFYSWQRYFLDLLGLELVWVNGAVAALVAVAGMLGNGLTAPLSRVGFTRTGILIASTVVQAIAVVLCGTLTTFYPVVALYLVWAAAAGVAAPAKQALLNAQIPSERRATLLSFDALLGDLGSGAGQSGLGYLSRARSIADAWVFGGVFLLLGVPLLVRARRGCWALDRALGAQQSAGGPRLATDSPVCEQRLATR